MSILKSDRSQRLARVQHLLKGKWVDEKDIVALLEQVIEPADRVCIEGDNQKQAVFLSKALASVDPKIIHDLHMVQSAISLPEHLNLFEKGIATLVDFSYSGPQGVRLASLIAQKKIQIGNIHTYLELYSRYFLDLTPKVALIVAEKADRAGNLYTGPNTEETPTIVEATSFKDGIVIAEVTEIVDVLPRVDIPADWVDIVVKSPLVPKMNALFTRDPAKIDEIKILMAMMAIKGIYGEYGVNRLNHGVGFDTCAIELILPTYAESLGLKGKICQYMMINPVPTLIPAIESGFLKAICSPGAEVGMAEYVKSRPDVFFVGKDGYQRSNRCYAQMAGHYAVDMFIGSTLQIDLYGNSSTATMDRVTGFGGAPNMGCDAPGRRHVSDPWLKVGKEADDHQNPIPRGRKLVVQMIETFQGPGQPTFVEKLDALLLQETMGTALAPVMIYGDDVTHIVTEEGIAHLHKCRTPEEREQAIRGVAGYTPVGLARDKKKVEALRERGIIVRPEDLGIRFSDATRNLLSAKSMKDLVTWSNGLYQPPTQFRNW